MDMALSFFSAGMGKANLKILKSFLLFTFPFLFMVFFLQSSAASLSSFELQVDLRAIFPCQMLLLLFFPVYMIAFISEQAQLHF